MLRGTIMANVRDGDDDDYHDDDDADYNDHADNCDHHHEVTTCTG